MEQAGIDYLVIGHVTRDLIPDGSWRTGGTVTFSAYVASRLGLRVGVLTSASHKYHLDMPNDASVRSVPSDAETVFENIYSPTGRTQYLRSQATSLVVQDLPDEWLHTPIVHLGPVAQEVNPQFLDVFHHSLVGLTPQGWLRTWNGSGLVHPVPLDQAESLLGKVDCVILSLEDLGGDMGLLNQYVEMSRMLVQTRGMKGSIVYVNGLKYDIPAFEAIEVDPTGAGDVFATAFFIRYYETQDPLLAARFANCVASFVVEGPGTSTIPDREQVEKRMLNGKLRQDG